MAEHYLAVDGVRAYCEEIFRRHGFDDDACRQIVDVVLTADLYGIESHGIQRMQRYHDSLRRKLVDVNARPDVVYETPLSAVMEANRAMGQTTAYMAMRLAIDKAKQHGFGAVTVRNCNHYGIAGYYAKMAVNEDLMGGSSTNTEAIAIPTFGKQPMLGTSPLALGMPADPYDFLFDCATTVVPRGKIEICGKRGLPLKPGWAADENGKSCLDAGHVLENINKKAFGGIFPIGGESVLTGSHKGYGLGIIAEIFTGILSGGDTSPHVKNGGMGDTSFGFFALDYGLFGDKASIRARVSALLQELRDSAKAEGHDRIYTHGELEMISHDEKLKSGIPAGDRTVEELISIGKDMGLNYADYVREVS